jgi:hypothetical protein
VATAADLHGHMQNWLARVGFPVRQSDFSYGIPGDTGQNAGVAHPGHVFISQKQRGLMNGVAARWGKRGALDDRQVEALRVLMHENLHQMRYGRGNGQIDPYEEAATESVTQDLLPIFTAKMYGSRLNSAPMRALLDGTDYPGETKNLRQLSRFGSGAADYTKRPARVWRRTFLHADADTRLNMVNQATAARVEWGKRAGR